jgi:hypothetical protein
VQPYVIDLQKTVERATPRLLAIGEAASAVRSAPRQWSPREIIGHLIDSASNNHKRFVTGQFRSDLIFDGYEQNAWVAAQQYQEASWTDLIALWAAFNRHLAHVMAAVPDEVRARLHGKHNFFDIATRSVPADHPVTLDFLMEDYVVHLHHHLEQVLGDDWSAQS